MGWITGQVRMMERQKDVIRLKIEHHEGTIYISSDDLPGLWLWGSDPKEVFDSIAPSIKSLYKLNEGLEVEVKEAKRSKLNRWLFTRLFRGKREVDRYNVYPSHHHLNGAHGC